MSSDSDYDSDCPICMESLDSSAMVVMSCKHRFCLDCVTKVLVGIGNKCGKNSCPLCRCDIVSPKTFDDVKKHLTEERETEEHDIESESDESESDESESDESESDESESDDDFTVEEINSLVNELRAFREFIRVA